MAWPGFTIMHVHGIDRWQTLDTARTNHVLARAREIYPGAEVSIKEPTSYSHCSANMAVVRATRDNKSLQDIVICVHCNYTFNANDPGMGG